jgi:hypothetical protein
VTTLPSNARVTECHIDDVKVGDTVLHHGEIKTVCSHNIKTGAGVGKRLWGDSYTGGLTKVKRITFHLETKNATT